LICNCPDFKKTAGKGGIAMDPEKTWITPETRCMHIRLLYENFEEDILSIPNVPEPEEGHLQYIKQKIRQSSLSSANSEVVIVSHANYLVLSVSLSLGDLPVFVKIHHRTHNTTSNCKCSKRIIRNSPDYWLKYTKHDLCKHILAVAKQTRLLNQYLTLKHPPKFRKEKLETFSKETGKWNSAALLKHKPKQRDDQSYVK
jgi:hypothetical protein